MKRVALVGAGRMGTIHGRNAAAHPRLQLACVVEHDAGRAAEAALEWRTIVATLDAALADPSIEGVIVANPTSAHLETCLAALAAGKRVFCEKPLDLDSRRLAGSAATLDAASHRLFVAFNRRFDPHYRALKARIAAGDIGRLESLQIVNHDPAPPPPAFIPTSGGLFRDFSIHDFDMAHWLLDEPVSEVFAWAACLVDPEIARLGDVDTAKILLRTASGRLCVISNSRRTAVGYDQRIEAFGSQGCARVDNVTLTTVVRGGVGGFAADPILGAFPARYAQAYAAEMDHFADMLERGVPPSTGSRDNLRALVLADAASRAAAAGAPVRL
jgi:myo-inositol 2-dehydrogenase/D-chiro-inositol 1-dehydrogenase